MFLIGTVGVYPNCQAPVIPRCPDGKWKYIYKLSNEIAENECFVLN